MNAQSKIEPVTVPAVYTAINAVMEHMSKEGISKDRNNEQQRYRFRGIDDIYNALSGVLAKHKLIMLPFVHSMQREERQTKSGGALNYTILTVDFTMVSAIDGSQAVVRTIGEAMDSADKSANKAQSAALKYAALQVFMIPTEGDNDADATTHDVAAQMMPDAEWSKLAGLIKATSSRPGDLCRHYDVKDLRHLSMDQYFDAIEALNRKLAKLAKDETDQKAANASNPTDNQRQGEFAGAADDF